MDDVRITGGSGTILLQQERGGEHQEIEVSAALVPRLISELFAAAVADKAGMGYPLPVMKGH